MERRKSVVIALIANFGGFIFGMVLSWSSPIAGQLVENEKLDMWVSSEMFGWIVGVMALGGSMSALISGYVRNVFGTKLTIIAFNIPMIVGYALVTFAVTPSMLLAGRFLSGISVGAFASLIPIYVGEIAPKEVRGTLLSFFLINLALGIIFILTVGYFFLMFMVNLVCMIIPIFYAIAFIYTPESPSMLITKNRQEEAMKVFLSLRGNSCDLREFDEIKQKTESKSFAQIFRVTSTKKALVLQLFLFFFFQMNAPNVVLFYSTYIFTVAGVNIDPGISSIIIGIIILIAASLGSNLIEKFGRRILICSSYTLTFISLIGIGSYFTFPLPDHFQWLPLVFLCVFMFTFNFGIAPVTYTLLGEIFADETKKFVAPICQTLSFFLTFLLGMTFPIFVASIGMGSTFYMFAAFTFVGLVFVIIFVPETKGKSKQEILKMLE